MLGGDVRGGRRACGSTPARGRRVGLRRCWSPGPRSAWAAWLDERRRRVEQGGRCRRCRSGRSRCTVRSTVRCREDDVRQQALAGGGIRPQCRSGEVMHTVVRRVCTAGGAATGAVTQSPGSAPDEPLSTILDPRRGSSACRARPGCVGASRGGSPSGPTGARFDRDRGPAVPWNVDLGRRLVSHARVASCARASGGGRRPPLDPQRSSTLVQRHARSALDVPTAVQSGVPSEQAHLPAEQPPSGQDPRLPAAHAHPRRPRDPRRRRRKGRTELSA